MGPRIGRFEVDGTVNSIPGHSTVLITLGAFILWTGFLAFNAGSTLKIVGQSNLVGKVDIFIIFIYTIILILKFQNL